MHRMKRLLLSCLIGLMALSGVWAAPALKGFFTVSQPDGTQLSVAQFGDEHYHWTETADGTLVVNKSGAYYVAAIDDNGELSATDLLAHEAPQRSNREQQLTALQSSRLALFRQQRERVLSRSIDISPKGGYLPHKGNTRVLTILVAFSDSAFTVNDPIGAFDQYLNGETQHDLGNKNHYNIASVQKYFSVCSQGLFTPQFDIVGPVTLPNNLAYYGGSKANGSDDRFSEFCRNTVEQAKDLVPDWTVYDNDGDGNVELVCIIFAGYGQNQGGGAETLWAKASQLYMKIDSIPRINFFNCSSEHFHPTNSIDAEGLAMSEYINGTGVFIHEMSHCMGLPDLYQTTGDFFNNNGMEAWDVMDYGLYNRNGFAPAAYTAWEKEVMGWTALKPIDIETHIDGMLPLDEGGEAYKIVNNADGNGNDFIVMESVAKRGLNSFANGSGLLVYHVAYPYQKMSMTDSPNNIEGRPSIAVVPASGTFLNIALCGTDKQYTRAQWKESMAGAVFPGLANVTLLTSDMGLPNFLFYQGDDGTLPVGFSLHNITETDAGISFDVKVSGPDGILPIIPSATETSHDCYDLLGRRLSNSSTYNRGLYIDRNTGKKYLK